MLRTSLVVQWLRIHLPVQGTQVRSPVCEDPTGLRETKPSCHNYCLEPMLLNKRSAVMKSPRVAVRTQHTKINKFLKDA